MNSYEQMFLTALKTYIWTPQHLSSTSSARLWEKCTVLKIIPYIKGKKTAYTPQSFFSLIIKGKTLAEESDTVLLFLVLRGKIVYPHKMVPIPVLRGKTMGTRTVYMGYCHSKVQSLSKGFIRGSNLTVLHGGQCISTISSTQLQALKDLHTHPPISKVDAVFVADKKAGQLETLQSMSNIPPCKCDQRS